MAQRTEKEETEFKVLETLTTTTTPTLCSNNCGVTANPSTNNMCQKCFNASVAAAAGVDPNPISKKSSRSVNLRSTPARVVIRPRRSIRLERSTTDDKPMFRLPEESRADRIQMPVRRPFLLRAPLLRSPRLQLRLQNRRPRGDR
ncbi:hypothetical protein Bca52824_041491 [Brassica carinata]|uniref:A20-type domain-containing protein n=1 Tax=Brassica carinata TaxID=52824 RepID=A0A8X7RVG9_BRACI|nr:hypothetical protein Bca52824_041491 [Brassica carinata]